MAEQVESSLSRGLAWLVNQQAADGGWHSATYGQLKDGAAVTVLALDALSHVRGELGQRYKSSIDRGLAFLARGITKRGTLASPDGSLDFPTYASALWLAAVTHLGRDAELAESCKQLVEYLLAALVAD